MLYCIYIYVIYMCVYCNTHIHLWLIHVVWQKPNTTLQKQ